MKLLNKFVVTLLVVTLLIAAAPAPAQAAEYYPATVIFVSATEDSVTVEVSNLNNWWECFEYRSDGGAGQVIGANYNTNYTDLYPYTCVNGGTKQITIPANEYVEVRKVFGAERDTDFDWVRFDVAEAEPVGLMKQEAYVMAYTIPTKPIEGFENYTSCNVISYEQDGVLIDPSQQRITMVCSKGPDDVTGGLVYVGTVVETAIVYRWVDADGKVQRYTWRGMEYPFKYGKQEDAMYTMVGRKLDLYPRVEGASEWIRENSPDVFGQ